MIQRTIKLHTGVEKTLNSTKIITKTEWQKAAEKLYGSDAKQWRLSVRFADIQLLYRKL